MFQRKLSERLKESLSDTPAVYLRGARQVGKSTLVKMIADSDYPAGYMTLDNQTLLDAATSDPRGFVAGLELPAIIDEVQRSPELLLAIKERIDAERRPGMFLLTGSAGLMSMPKVADSLAGRMDTLTLWPLSQGELAGTRETFVQSLLQGRVGDLAAPAEDYRDLSDVITTGGFPEPVRRASAKRRADWFDSYVRSMIERDVRGIANIQNITDITRILGLLAARTATLLNRSEMSRTLGIPHSSLSRYMNILAQLFLVHELPAWSGNLGKRLVRTPKTHLVDTGLAAALIGADEQSLDRNRELAGRLLENFVINEIKKQLEMYGLKARAYHFRSHSGQEVDLLLESASGQAAGLEIKLSATVRNEDFKGLRHLKDLLGARFVGGAVLHAGRDRVPFGDDLYAVPVSSLWED
jgi:predicted AAA+ superfamily ATPase